MHNAVSRVTTNKYIATPRGLFELKYFFASAIAASREGESHSEASVPHPQPVETGPRALSTSASSIYYWQDGVDVAQRTVAKYREACVSLLGATPPRKRWRFSSPHRSDNRRGLTTAPGFPCRLRDW